MVHGSAYAQIMRMCADNALSACIMRGCVFSADYAQMRIVRMCPCAVLRSVCICAACASAHVRCCAVCAEAEPIAGRPQVLHIPSYSRERGRIHQKTIIFGHLRRKSLLNESREPYPCHTFRSDAAEIFTPSRSLKATHAQRRNSCRSGACPNVQIPHPCRLLRRQDPQKKPSHNQCAARKWARPPCKSLCQPAARSNARDAGRQTTKSRQTPPPPQDPPICCSLLSLEKTKGPGRGAGTWGRQPPPLGRLFRRLGVYRQAN